MDCKRDNLIWLAFFLKKGSTYELFFSGGPDQKYKIRGKLMVSVLGFSFQRTVDLKTTSR